MAKILRGTMTTEQLFQVINCMIEGKNDRESAIIAGAYLEGLLFDYLSSVLVSSDLQDARALFNHPRPLNSFGNIVSVAYAFGLISHLEFNGLRIIQKVRNFAAHSLGLSEKDSVIFSSEPVRKMLREFHPKAILAKASDELRHEAEMTFEAFLDLDAAGAFRLIFCQAALNLEVRRTFSVKLKAPDES